MSNSDNSLTRESLMDQIAESWTDFQNYLAALSEEQLTKLSDAAGWTVKDHVIHVAMWEKASLAMLEGKSKREVLDISPEVWEQDDDPINAVLQQRYQNMPWNEVMQTLREHHDGMMKKLNSMSEEDFQRPYSHYQTSSANDRVIIDFVYWDTVHHYGEHRTWIAAIVDKA